MGQGFDAGSLRETGPERCGRLVAAQIGLAPEVEDHHLAVDLPDEDAIGFDSDPLCHRFAAALEPAGSAKIAAKMPSMVEQDALRRFSLPNLRAAWWAVMTARRTRLRLRRNGFDAAIVLSPPPRLPAAAERGVRGALRRRGESCLVRSIVLQSWLAAHGEPRDLIIGVRAPGEDFAAHAWIEGEMQHGEA